MDLKVNDKKVICFDLDDTLYNEIDYLRSGYKTIAKSIEPQWQSLLAQMFSIYRSGRNAFEYIEKHYNLSIKDQLELYRNHLPDIVPFDGVKSLFESIDLKGGKIVIITDGRSISQRNKIKSLGLESLVKLILVSEETGHDKPHPHNFHMVLEEFPHHEYCYIGDNLAKDFIVPNRLGWQTVCLLDKGRNIHNNAFEYSGQPENHPDHYIEHIQELRVI